MIRQCDGLDPNLLKKTGDGTYVRCDCGLVFDDERRLVIFPHEQLGVPVKW